jgi:hypothetical protein
MEALEGEISPVKEVSRVFIGLGCLVAAFADIFRWLEEFFKAIAVIQETKRRRTKKQKRGHSEYPCWYCFAITALDWTACGGRAGTNG